jgi:hypothetical protein
VWPLGRFLTESLWLQTANGLEYGTDVVAAESADAVARMIVSDPGSVDTGVIFMSEGTMSSGAKICSTRRCWGRHSADSNATHLRYEMWVNATGAQVNLM